MEYVHRTFTLFFFQSPGALKYSLHLLFFCGTPHLFEGSFCPKNTSTSQHFSFVSTETKSQNYTGDFVLEAVAQLARVIQKGNGKNKKKIKIEAGTNINI